MPGFDETDEEIRYRVRDPDNYDDYGTKDIGNGVQLVFGHNKESGNWEVQSVRFDRENFTVEQAKQWVDDHPEALERMSKISPMARTKTLWKMEANIQKVAGTVDSEHFYIYGTASMEIVDQENDKITAKALEYGLPHLLRRARLSVDHTDIIAGEILRELEHKNTTYMTTVKNGQLMLIGDVWGDTKFCRQIRKAILAGEYSMFSISGMALDMETICDKEGCVNNIDKIELSAVALCKRGLNQAAHFTLLKAAHVDDAYAPISEASEGGMKTAKEDKTDKEEADTDAGKSDDKTPPQSSDEHKQEEGEEEEEETSEESIQDALKAITEKVDSALQTLSGLSARVDALEQDKAAQDEEGEEEDEEEEGEEEDEEEEDVAASDDSEESEDKSEVSEQPENASPAKKAVKKSLAPKAGGTQDKPDSGSTEPAWVRIGKQVHEAGGFAGERSPYNRPLKKQG